MTSSPQDSSPSTVQNYLFFGGKCEEALEFYRHALDARLGMMLRFSESPEPVPADMLPEGFGHKIMHSEFTVGNTTIMASDGCEEISDFSGFSLALSVADEKAAHRFFNALAKGGAVRMPLGRTFWSPCYGQVTDKFGVHWMVMVPAEMK